MVKTELELAIELRDKVALRAFEAKANMAYWELVKKKAKPDTQDRVDATNNIALNQQNRSKDIKFLQEIDKLIEEIKK